MEPESEHSSLADVFDAMAMHIAADAKSRSEGRSATVQQACCPGCGRTQGREGYSASMWQRVRRARFEPPSPANAQAQCRACVVQQQAEEQADVVRRQAGVRRCRQCGVDKPRDAFSKRMWARANEAAAGDDSVARRGLVCCAACTAAAADAVATASRQHSAAAAELLVCSVCTQRRPAVRFSKQMTGRAAAAARSDDAVATMRARALRCENCVEAQANTSRSRRVHLENDVRDRLAVLDRLWGDIVPAKSKNYIARRVSEDVRRERERSDRWCLYLYAPETAREDDRWQISLAKLPDLAMYKDAFVRYKLPGGCCDGAVCGRVRKVLQDGRLRVDRERVHVRPGDIQHVPWTENRFLMSAFILAYVSSTNGFGDLCYARLRCKRSRFYGSSGTVATRFSYTALSSVCYMYRVNDRKLKAELSADSKPEECILEKLGRRLRDRLEAEAATMLQTTARCWLSRQRCARERAERTERAKRAERAALEAAEQAALEAALQNQTKHGVTVGAEFYPCARMGVVVLVGEDAACSQPYFGEVVGMSEDGDGWTVRRLDTGGLEMRVSSMRLLPRAKPLAKDEREMRERHVRAQSCWRARKCWGERMGRWVRVKIACRPWQRLLLAALGHEGLVLGAPGYERALHADLVARIHAFLEDSTLCPWNPHVRRFDWFGRDAREQRKEQRNSSLRRRVCVDGTHQDQDCLTFGWKSFSPGEIGRVIDHTGTGRCGNPRECCWCCETIRDVSPQQIKVSLEKPDGSGAAMHVDWSTLMGFSDCYASRGAFAAAELELLGEVASSELDERYGTMGEAEAAGRARHWRAELEQLSREREQLYEEMWD